jgi:hypothetical protein
MSILDELRAIDLGPITAARGRIAAAMTTADLQKILGGNSVENALGELGTRMAALERLLDGKPADALAPFAADLEALERSVGIDPAIVADYTSAVREGLTTLAPIVRSLASPADLGAAFGGSLGDVLGEVKQRIRGFSLIGGGELAEYKQVTNLLKRDLAHDLEALVDLAIDTLIPFPRKQLAELRSEVDRLLEGTRSIALASGREQGLVDALDRIAIAARNNDGVALGRGIAFLEQVRTNTLASVGNDLVAGLRRLGELNLSGAQSTFERLAETFDSAQPHGLSIIDDLRTVIASADVGGAIDTDAVRAQIHFAIDKLDGELRTVLFGPIDEFIDETKELVAGLLDDLPLREMRDRVTEAIHEAALAIHNLDIERYARALGDQLEELRVWISSVDLTAEVRGALASVEQTIRSAVDGVVDALSAIGQALEAVSAGVAPIVGRATELLGRLRGIVDEVKQTIEEAPIEDAAQQVIASLHEIRQNAEDLFRSADVPDALRPAVSQLVKQLQQIDIGKALTDRISRSVGKLDLFKNLGLDRDLADVQHTLDNLIPRQLAGDIENEIGEALKVFQHFDVSTLTSAIKRGVESTAARVEAFDPAPYVEALRRPFGILLAAIDRLDPHQLLAPLIDEYRAALAKLIPSPEAVAKELSDLIGGTADELGNTFDRAQAPLVAADGSDPGAPPSLPDLGSSRPQAGTPDQPQLLPGDTVRLISVVPRKLHEAFKSLDAGAAGDLVRRIDSLCGGLATALRNVAGELAAIDDRVLDALDGWLEVTGAHVDDARTAIDASTLPTSDRTAALAAIAAVSPGSLRAELLGAASTIRERALALTNDFGETAATLELIAGRLEDLPLASLDGSLDRLLEMLDVEPLAREVDRLVTTAVAQVPAVLTALQADIKLALERFSALLEEIRPVRVLGRFASIAAVVREHLDVLDPTTLADELAEVHAVVRDAVAAYDPASFVDELRTIVAAVAQAIRRLDPSQWLRPEDIARLQATIDRVRDALPSNAFREVGEELAAGADALAAIDVGGLVTDVTGLSDRVRTAFESAIDSIEKEIDALIDSLQLLGTSGAS